MNEELLKGLTEEQIAKVKACKSKEEVLDFAKEEGIELTEEQLKAVSGGCGSTWYTGGVCPNCGSTNTKVYNGTWSHGATIECFDCGRNDLR